MAQDHLRQAGLGGHFLSGREFGEAIKAVFPGPASGIFEIVGRQMDVFERRRGVVIQLRQLDKQQRRFGPIFAEFIYVSLDCHTGTAYALLGNLSGAING